MTNAEREAVEELRFNLEMVLLDSKDTIEYKRLVQLLSIIDGFPKALQQAKQRGLLRAAEIVSTMAVDISYVANPAQAVEVIAEAIKKEANE